MINDHFAATRAKKRDLLANPDYLRQILARGADKAREKATRTLELARDRMGLRY